MQKKPARSQKTIRTKTYIFQCYCSSRYISEINFGPYFEKSGIHHVSMPSWLEGWLQGNYLHTSPITSVNAHVSATGEVLCLSQVPFELVSKHHRIKRLSFALFYIHSALLFDTVVFAVQTYCTLVFL